MNKYLLVLLYLCTISYQSIAQKGDLFLKNYLSPIPNIDNFNYSITQGNEGIMYFANTVGVLSYDGVNWNTIRTQNTPTELLKDDSGEIYIGCTQSYGYIKKDNKGKEKFIHISSFDDTFGEIKQILLTEKDVYFYTDRVLFKVNKKTKKTEKIWFAKKDESFSGIIQTNSNDILVNIIGKGLHKLSQGELKQVSNTNQLKNQYINAFIQYNSKKILIGTDKNKLYLYDGTKIEPYVFKNQIYINENSLISLYPLKDNKFAISTISGGAIIVDKKSKSILQTINYQTGLPDDEILAMYEDNNNGLWLCTEYGMTRADINLPIQNFSEYPGLAGKITTISKLDTVLYVATTEGLFYLDKVDEFEELIKVVRRGFKRLVERENNANQKLKLDRFEYSERVIKFLDAVFNSENQLNKRERRKRKKDARRKKREERRKKKKKRKNKKIVEKEDKNDSKDTAESENDITTTTVLPKKNKKKDKVIEEVVFVDTVKSFKRGIQKYYALQSIPFTYKPVENINAKCNQILKFQNKLLVISNKGLFEVIESKARLIVKNNFLNFISPSSYYKDYFFIGTEKGIIFLKYLDGRWRISSFDKEIQTNITSIISQGKTLWLGAENQVFKLILDERGLPTKSQSYDLPNNYLNDVIVRLIDDRPLFFSTRGIYTYNKKQDKLKIADDFQQYANEFLKIIYKQSNYTWIKPESKWLEIQNNSTNTKSALFLSLFKYLDDVYVDTDKNIWIVGNNALYKVKANTNYTNNGSFKTYIRNVKDKSGKLLQIENLKLSHKNNGLVINLSTPFYIREKAIEYQYKIRGYDNDWSIWENNSEISFPVLPSGEYEISIRAKNIFGDISEDINFEFSVSSPFWQSTWFIIIIIIMILGLLYLISYLRTKALRASNQRLEQKVNEKTAEIAEKNTRLEEAFKNIDRKNREITDSIDYAQRIQQAILPLEKNILKNLDDAFVFYQPRDIVSGDFYWFSEKKENYIIISADCTGHGVPGALMSMIGYSLLNEIVNEKNIDEPELILKHLDIAIIRMLKQGENNDSLSDGMDISICKIDKNKQKLIFSGAGTKLYFKEEDKVKFIKGNIYGVGGGIYHTNKIFERHEISIKDEMYFYLTSDGYLDQFGGENDKKFSRARFMKLIKLIAHKSGQEQKALIKQTHKNWKGDKRQIDDILVLGFRLIP